ncbi:MAG: ABC transporter permease, partial [Candidatus Binatia bacterium]
MTRNLMTQFSTILPSLFALLSAFTVVSLGLWLSGINAFLVFSALLQGAGGDLYRLSETCVKACPLLLTGLSVSLALHA